MDNKRSLRCWWNETDWNWLLRFEGTGDDAGREKIFVTLMVAAANSAALMVLSARFRDGGHFESP